MTKFYICDTRQQGNPAIMTMLYMDTEHNIILEAGEQFIWPDFFDDDHNEIFQEYHERNEIENGSIIKSNI